jgi:isopropylmalate/homocitrate/citramalate synthase
MSLEERLFKSFDDQQKVEHEAREIETLIKSFEGSAGLLPKRQYGQPVDPSQFGLTLKSIIERNHKELAAYLKISTGYWERKLKEEDELTQMVERMKEKTEALRQQNQEERARRQYRNVYNLDHNGRPRI